MSLSFYRLSRYTPNLVAVLEMLRGSAEGWPSGHYKENPIVQSQPYLRNTRKSFYVLRPVWVPELSFLACWLHVAR